MLSTFFGGMMKTDNSESNQVQSSPGEHDRTSRESNGEITYHDSDDIKTSTAVDIEARALLLHDADEGDWNSPTWRDAQISSCIQLWKFWHSCILVSSYMYVGFLYWTILAMFYASCYWHLLNPYYLGFNPMAPIGLIIGFLLIPFILRIPFIRYFLKTPNGRLAESISTCLLLAAALQVQETSRTILLAVTIGLVINRLSLPSRSLLYESFSLSGGLLLLLCFRSLCWSLHPFDLMESWYIFSLIVLVGVLCSIIIKFEDQRTTDSVILHQDLGQQNVATDYELIQFQLLLLSSAYRWSVPKGKLFQFLYGLFSVVALSSITFLITTILTSDAVIPRWSGQEPATHGYIVTLCLSIGLLWQAYTNCISTGYPHEALSRRRSRYFSTINCFMMMTGFSFIIFLVGGCLFFVFRNSSQSVSFAGGCLFVFSVPTVLGCALYTYKNVNAIATTLGGYLMSFVMAIWMIGGFIVYLSWFAGHLVPVIGDLFFQNEFTIWFGSFIPLILSLVILQSICWVYANQRIHQHREKLTNPTSEPQHSPNSALEKKINTRSLFPSVAFVWILILLCLYLPSLRSRIYRYSQRGSRFVNPLFTTVTFNIQEGYSLPNKINAGFPIAQRIINLDNELSPNVWGFEESDSTNLLHMNRDWASFLSDSMFCHLYRGAPSWTSTPGVAILTTEKLDNPTFIKLPRGDEPLVRLVSWGMYRWRHSPTSPILAEIIVAVTHMSAFSEEARMLQLDAISQLIATDWANSPVVLLGDFNNNPSHTTKIWDNKSDVLPKGKLRLVNPEDRIPTLITESGDIDHIYYKGLCLKGHGVLNTFGISDHLPVWAKFDLPKVNGTELCS